MKKINILLILLIAGSYTHAQTLLFHEGFEPPSYADSVVSSLIPPGPSDWAICSSFSSRGQFSDSCSVKDFRSAELTTQSIDCSGFDKVYLSFSHICKIHMMDLAFVEWSLNAGSNWTQLTSNEYFGSLSPLSYGGFFNCLNYPQDWDPANNAATPTQAWWKDELFDLSAIAGDTNVLMIRFRLADGGTPGPTGNYGWLLDEIKVFGSQYEMLPPVFASFGGIFTGTITTAGPYTVAANITDDSGIDTAFIEYAVNGVMDTVGCYLFNNVIWRGEIPDVEHLDSVCYRMVAVDASPMRNVATKPASGYYCFHTHTNNAVLDEILSPSDGCGMGVEPVTLRIKNTGEDTISKLLTASYVLAGTTDTVSEAVLQPIPPGEEYDFSFNQGVELGNITQDTTFQLHAFLSLPGDNNISNNALSKAVQSGIRPPAPLVHDTTIGYGDSVFLTTSSSIPLVEWYSDSAAMNLVSTGLTYQTPPLFNHSTYYIQSVSGALPCPSIMAPLHVTVSNIPQVDVALEQLLAPQSTPFLSHEEDVRVVIKSYGLQPINNIPIICSINDSIIVRDTLTNTMNILETLDHTFSQHADLSVEDDYFFKIWVDVPGDQVHGNDTIFDTISHLPANYCASYATEPAYGSDIGNVSIANLNNGSPTPQTNNPTAVNGYTDFTQSISPLNLIIGQGKSISIKRIINGNIANTKAGVKVYIDYDRNGSFDAATETAFSKTINHYLYPANGTLTVPSWVAPGLTMMRIVLEETNNVNNVHPCGTYDRGETEDYLVNLYAMIPQDAGINAISSPSGTETEGEQVPVDVTIENLGSQAIDTMLLSYSLNGSSPVTTGWTGQLAPGASTTVNLPALTVPAGDNSICFTVDLAGDINVGNNQLCLSFYGDPLYDAEAIALTEPSGYGCEVGIESVTIRIGNDGLDTIDGGLWAHYYRMGDPTLVSEPVNAVIPPGQYLDHTFTTPVNLIATLSDTIWKLVGYVSLNGDIEPYNDTTTLEVTAYRRPAPPLLSDDTVSYGSPATLSAQSPDSVLWYDDSSSVEPLAEGPVFITPAQFVPQEYWAEAISSSSSGSPNIIGPGSNTSSYTPTYGFYDYGWSASIYTSSEIEGYGLIDSISYRVSNAVGAYTMHNQRIYLMHTTASTFPSAARPDTSGMELVYEGTITWTGPGWFNIPLNNSFYYDGSSNLMVYYTNHDGSYTSGYPVFNVHSSPGRTIYDYQDNSFPGGSGSLTSNRPDIRFPALGTNCSSERVPAAVSISNPPLADLDLLDVLSPQNGFGLDSAETLSAVIRQNGITPTDSFQVQFVLDSHSMVTETVATQLVQGDTMHYSFNAPLDLSVFGKHDLTVIVNLPGDTNQSNDTIHRSIFNNIPHCESYALYGSAGSDIGNVTIGSINQGNASPIQYNAQATGSYTNYMQNLPPLEVVMGNSYAISVSAISSGALNPADLEVYIDWNQDGTFDNTTENPVSGSCNAAAPTYSSQVQVPYNAVPGYTRMRIVLDEDGNAQACGTYDNGETEDYGVYIVDSRNNSGIISIDEPDTILDIGLSDVEVSLKNFGTDTLYSVMIGWSVNNIPQSPLNWTGSLAPLQTEYQVNLGSFNFQANHLQIRAWTYQPNGSQDVDPTNDSKTKNIRVCQVLSGSYSIGGSQSDFPSFLAATYALENCFIGGPVTFHVEPGTYTERLYLTEVLGSGPVYSVSFQSSTLDPGDVILTDSSLVPGSPVVQILGADHFQLKYLTIRSDAQNPGTAVSISGDAEDVFISHCQLLSGQSYDTGVNVVEVPFGSNRNIQISNCLISGGSKAIFWEEGGNRDTLVYILENNISGWNHGGLDLNDIHGLYVSGNRIEPSPDYQLSGFFGKSAGQNADTVGIKGSTEFAYGIRLNNIREFEVSRNSVHMNAGCDHIHLKCSNIHATSSSNAVIVNNMLSTQGMSSRLIRGLSLENVQNLDVFYNSISIPTGHSSSRALYAADLITTGNTVRNNILMNGGAGMCWEFRPGFADTMDHNIFYTKNNLLGKYGYINIPDLAYWQSVTGQDAHSFFLDPRFLSDHYLMPSDSLADNTGSPVSSYPEDYEGNPRSLATPDAGALEFSPLSMDLRLYSWDYPAPNRCLYSSNEPVGIRIINQSTSPQGNINVSYSVDNGLTFITDSIPGPIASGDTLPYVFPVTADLSDSVLYQCIATLSHANDPFPYNDTIRLDILPSGADTTPYLQDFSSFVPLMGGPVVQFDGWTCYSNTGFNFVMNIPFFYNSRTGPKDDHSPGNDDMYIYSNSFSGAEGDSTYLLSPCLDLSSLTKPELRFWYYMYGDNMVPLHVDIKQNGQWVKDVFTLAGIKQTNSSQPWLEARVSLWEFPGTERIRFRVVKGTSNYAIVALDDFSVEEAPEYDLELVKIIEPGNGCGYGFSQVELKVHNRGRYAVDSLSMSYQLENHTVITENLYQTIQPGDTLLYAFNTLLNLSTYQDTSMVIHAEISHPGDASTWNNSAHKKIIDGISPPQAISYNDTIQPGEHAHLSVDNPSSAQAYLWYDPASGTPVASGDSFTSGALYQQSVFGVNSVYRDRLYSLETGPGSSHIMGNPAAGSSDYGWSANIYLAREIMGAGPIEAISFYQAGGGFSGSISDQQLFLAHTKDTAWRNLHKPEPMSMTRVYQGNVHWNAGWTRITLDKAFDYNGVDNLVVYWESLDGSGSVAGTPTFSCSGDPGIKMAKATYQGSEFPNGNGSWSQRPDIRIYQPSSSCMSDMTLDTVFVLSTLSIDAGNDTTICLLDSIPLHARASGGLPPYSYSWLPSATVANPYKAMTTAYPALNTMYTLMVTDYAGDIKTDSVYVEVNDLPSVSLSLPWDTLCLNDGAQSLSGGLPVGGTYSGPGINGNMFYPSNAGYGMHSIFYTYAEPATMCMNSAHAYVLVDNCSGILEHGSNIAVDIYPNPSDGHVVVEVKGVSGPARIEIFTVNGKKLLVEEIGNANNQSRMHFDLERLVSGLYFVKVWNREGVAVRKLVIY